MTVLFKLSKAIVLMFCATMFTNAEASVEIIVPPTFKFQGYSGEFDTLSEAFDDLKSVHNWYKVTGPVNWASKRIYDPVLWAPYGSWNGLPVKAVTSMTHCYGMVPGACDNYPLAGPSIQLLGPRCPTEVVSIKGVVYRFYATDLPQDHLPDRTFRCVMTLPDTVLIALSGGTQTTALPAGPTLGEVATVTKNGAPYPGVTVSISLSGDGSLTSLSGMTDGAGKFHFTYAPPARHSAFAGLTAICGECVNVATQTINVVECPSCGPFGNPISATSGQKLQAETDWLGYGAHSLSMVRHYRSSGALQVGLGSHWSHEYAATIKPVVGDSNERVVHLGSGSKALFSRPGVGAPWVAANGQDSLTEIPEGWRYTRASDESTWLIKRWLINTESRLSSITQRNGWTTSLSYNEDDYLASVTNAFGRSLRFGYDISGVLTSVATPDGTTLAYTSDATGRLSSARAADGTSKTYLYDDLLHTRALTGIQDELGQTYASFSYDINGRAINTKHSGDTKSYSLNYGGGDVGAGSLTAGSSVPPGLYQSTVEVTDPRGTLQTWRYQGGDGSVRLLSASGAFEGGQIANSTFLSGTTVPEAETDFLGVQTMYTWDPVRRLPLSITKAAAKPEAQTTSTQWHPTLRLPVLVTEPTRSTAYSYDALGNKLTETITDSVTGRISNWAWSYTPQGQVATSTDPNNRVTTYSYYADTAFTGVDPDAIGHTVGDLQSITNPASHVTSFALYDKAGRVRQSVDAKGITTDTTYTPRGWVSSTTVTPTGGVARTTSYSYDAVGQLKIVTQPDGSTVTYSYDPAHRLIGIKDAKGNEVAYTLDNAGNRTGEQIKDPSGVLQRSISRTFDALNRVQQVNGAAQ